MRQRSSDGLPVLVQDGRLDARRVVLVERADRLVQRAALLVVQELGRDDRRRGQQAREQLARRSPGGATPSIVTRDAGEPGRSAFRGLCSLAWAIGASPQEESEPA
jgi:hypothetical protein